MKKTMAGFYFASCVFTARFPELSFRIQDYVRERFGFTVVRCCVSGYKLKEFEEKMPEGEFRERWSRLPDSGPFSGGDRVYSLCHNCNNIIEETRPGVPAGSLWELIDSDPSFSFPDRRGLRAFVQDCWRSKDRIEEQAAVRRLLEKMNIEAAEIPERGGKTDFCGVSLYRAQPPRNPKLAPHNEIHKPVFILFVNSFLSSTTLPIKK
ncbi:MAG: hypothetical protein II713_03695 [Clostridia bacterium]|nr:hypothetical protein [Clostridia bacterium]